MVGNFLRKIFGSRNERLIKQLYSVVAKINQLEEHVRPLTDEQLTAKTAEFRTRFAQGESLDDLLPESFAVVREVGRRVLNMRHFDVQLIGGMVLHKGKIAEMRTGEGKTLVATLAAYLNAIPGKGVHIITVNDYLARRDAEWMGQIFRFLGMTVGVVVNDMNSQEKKEAYATDISYGTNNEFGFDYLRDNMAFSPEDRVQRSLNFAIIDEVDSILIDEARTPLIISGPTDESSDLYLQINSIIPRLTRQEKEHDANVPNPVDTGDYTIDEKSKQVHLTEMGFRNVEQLMLDVGLLVDQSSLYDSANITLMHHLDAALRANVLYQKNVDYIVKNGKVVIVDEFTGRTLSGRRWSDGLHQAVEAKEGVDIEPENQTLASITFQNLFRMYNKLSGMTGTADTEASEFLQIYGLEVAIVPTNQLMVRKDANDLVFLGIDDKMLAVIDDIKDCNLRGQPVLVGTTSIEMSEFISAQLNKHDIKHEVLNAKQHEREADIIAQAGRPGVVTIATNMAGRGTDIVLGGNLEAELHKQENLDDLSRQRIKEEWKKRHDAVLQAGGLHIIGTERHESRRIDNQLRGRAGRQGDAGSSRFYLSLKDNLMRIFASERVTGLMQRLGMKPGEPIEHPWVTRAVENAQRKVEAHNFDTRKNLLEYDNVANDQRKFIYGMRNKLMESVNVTENIEQMIAQVVEETINESINPNSLSEQWNISALEEALADRFAIQLPVTQWLEQDINLHEASLRRRILDEITTRYKSKCSELDKKHGEGQALHLEKMVFFDRLDHHWKEHLAAMDHLRQGIHLHGYAQKNPKQEYKRIAFEMFEELLNRIQHDVARIILTVDLAQEEPEDDQRERREQQAMNLQYQHADAGSVLAGGPDEEEVQESHTPFVREERKVGRNEPCPCGSGKKYKQCHGKID